MVVLRKEYTDLTARLGLSHETLESQVGTLEGASLVTLAQLGQAYGAEALEENKFTQRILDSRVELPPFGYNPKPSEKRTSLRPFVGRTYHQPKEATHPSASEPLEGLLMRRRSEGAKLARLVHARPEVRSAVGRMIGGDVVPDGRADGVLSVRSVPQGTTGSSVSALESMPSSQTLYDLFYAMDYEILLQAALLSQNQTSGGSGSSVGGGTDSGSAGDTSEITNVLLGGKGSLEGMLGTTGLVSGLFGDTPEAASAGEPIESVDLGVLRLKRMIDKRDQMITAVKNVLDKWNQTAKVAIDNTRA